MVEANFDAHASAQKDVSPHEKGGVYLAQN
jgi:hypothetical protein